MNISDLHILLPFISLSTAVILIMLIIAFRRNHQLTFGLTLLAFLGALVFLWIIKENVPYQISTLLIFDSYALFFLALIFSASIILTLISYDYLKIHSDQLEEYYLLLLLAALGSSVLVVSQHFVTLFLGLEILSVSLYVLISYLSERQKGIEAGIKYLILAASASAFLLFGMALLYYATGTMAFTELASRLSQPISDSLLILTAVGLMIVGFGFKLAVAPFHMWTPDVYEGAPAPVTAFIATISKGGMFALIFRFFLLFDIYNYPTLIIIFTIIAIASMFIGNLLALMQTNVKRILAYSSIAHLGYLLVAFLSGGTYGIAAVSFYLVAYFITTIGAFAIISVISGKDKETDDIKEYRGLYWRRPWLSAIFTAMLLSLAGIPLTAGFVGKFYVLLAGIHATLWTLVVILVVNSAIGLYYYLRIIVAMYSQIEGQDIKSPVKKISYSFSSAAVLAILTLLLIWFGTYPYQLIDSIQIMVAGFFTTIP